MNVDKSTPTELAATESKPPPWSEARLLDLADPLASYRERFLPLPDDVVAYLDGNSLGRPTHGTRENLKHAVEDEWASRLIRAWPETWLDLPLRVGDALSEAVLGAAPGQVVVTDSTSVLLFKALHAAAELNPGRSEIVIDSSNFPTDRFVAQAVADQRGLTIKVIDVDPWAEITEEILAPHLNDQTAVVLLSHVNYRSAHINDLPSLNRLIENAGATAVWDLSHSAGALPVNLDASGVALAVGCTYKFLNSGPGAPAFLYARADLHTRLTQPIPGWMGAADVFGMHDHFEPALGIRRFLSGTPSIVALTGVIDGAALLADATIGAVRTKSLLLTQFVIDQFDESLADLGWELATPRNPEKRGSHVSIRRHDAESVCDRLTAVGVIADFRNPDGIRLGLSPLSTSFCEVQDAIEVLREFGGRPASEHSRLSALTAQPLPGPTGAC